MLSGFYKVIEIDPELAPLTCEVVDSTTTNTTNEARVDVIETWTLGKKTTSIFRF